MFMHTQGSGSKTALLLHGMASSSKTWQPLANDLLERDFTVHAPDLPGHGQGTRDISLYSVEAWRDMLSTSIGKVDLLVGHSIGGLLALVSKTRLNPQATVLIDPLLHFPPGIFGDISRRFFNLSQIVVKAPVEHNWDITSARALLRPRNLPKPSEDTLIVRPANSFVSPNKLMKKLSGVEIVTIPRSSHNLHLQNYPVFFQALSGFAQKRGVFAA